MIEEHVDTINIKSGKTSRYTIGRKRKYIRGIYIEYFENVMANSEYSIVAGGNIIWTAKVTKHNLFPFSIIPVMDSVFYNIDIQISNFNGIIDKDINITIVYDDDIYINEPIIHENHGSDDNTFEILWGHKHDCKYKKFIVLKCISGMVGLNRCCGCITKPT